MRTLFFILLIMLGSVRLTIAQNFESLQEIKLSTPDVFMKYLDQVYDCCCYVLQTPEEKKDTERIYAINFVSRWVEGCPDCRYKLTDTVKGLTENRQDLINLFEISYASVFFDCHEESIDMKNVNLEEKAIVKFLEYCNQDMNKIKLTKEMKQMIAEKNIAKL